MRQQLDFDAFVAARSRALMRTAWLLTGDWQLAEDLLRASLAKAYLAWHRIDEERAEAYVRRILVTTYATRGRRAWRGELASASVPDVEGPTDRGATADLRRVVVAALAQLPRRQRATVVLRYYCDLSEAETAETLGCSVGTVKSQAAKGLDRLRRSPLAAAVHEGTPMTQLSELDLAEVLGRTVPNREIEIAPQLAGRARIQAAALRRRRRMALASLAAATVLVVGVPAVVSVLDESDGAPAEEPTGDAVPCADDECGPATVVSAIRQPLELPAVPAGGACPVGPVRRLRAGVFSDSFLAVGSGPLYMSGADRQATVRMSASGGTWLDQKVIWVIDESYSGPLVLRGGRIDGDGLLRFPHYLGAVGYTGGSGDGKRHPELAYIRDGLNADGDPTSNSYPSGIHVSSPGCYAIQVDGDGFSQTLVFQAAGP